MGGQGLASGTRSTPKFENFNRPTPQKKFAYIIRKLGYKEPVPQDPHSLVLPTGEITTNPVRITETITDHFAAHHMRPSNLDPAAVWIHGLQSEDMEAVLSGAPSDQLGEGVANSNIPTPLLQLILEHCRTKVSPEVAAEIAEATAKPVLFHEFNSAIERAKRDKAPGSRSGGKKEDWVILFLLQFQSSFFQFFRMGHNIVITYGYLKVKVCCYDYEFRSHDY